MSKYPQIYVKEKFQDFLKTLTSVGKPPAVDKAYIKKLGFKSSYDTNFLQAIKFIGLVEDKRGGAPTEKWGELRSNFGYTLANCLRDGYADLYQFYPDAHLRDDEALSSYFRGNSDGSKDEVERMVTAFNAVKELAEFSSEPADEIAESETSEDVDPNRLVNRGAQAPHEIGQQQLGGQPSININIQLQLPSDATGEVYEKFFEAMRSKLLSR